MITKALQTAPIKEAKTPRWTGVENPNESLALTTSASAESGGLTIRLNGVVQSDD